MDDWIRLTALVTLLGLAGCAVTPGTVIKVSLTASGSTPSGVPSSSTCDADLRSFHPRGNTHRAIRIATAESIQAFPVGQMSAAPTNTATEPRKSAHTSRCAPRALSAAARVSSRL
jgi:hypothetical protein